MPMKTFVVKYYELGEEKIVSNVFDRRRAILPAGKYAFVDPQIAPDINEQVIKGNKVTINKKEVDMESMLAFDDFVITEVSQFEKDKERIVNDVQTDLTDLPILMSNLDILEFVFTFCRFAERCIFIWDKDNIEERYLEILNTGEEKLIDDLERYLELKDRVRLVMTRIQNIKRVIERIRSAETSEDLKKIYATYKGR